MPPLHASGDADPPQRRRPRKPLAMSRNQMVLLRTSRTEAGQLPLLCNDDPPVNVAFSRVREIAYLKVLGRSNGTSWPWCRT